MKLKIYKIINTKYKWNVIFVTWNGIPKIEFQGKFINNIIIFK